MLLPKPDYAEPLKRASTKRRIAFDAPHSRPDTSVRVFSALRTWLADYNDNLAFRELLAFACDSGALDIPSPKARKAESKHARDEALAEVSRLWIPTFEGASLHQSLKAAKKTPLLSKFGSIVEELAKATSGSLKEFADRTFDALQTMVKH